MALDGDAGTESANGQYVPSMKAAFGAQLVGMYFGGQSCGFCRQTAFKEAMRRLPSLLRAQAVAANHTFHWVGVAVEWEVREGIDYLFSLGDFDEVSSGGSWWSTSVAQRLFGEKPPAVPTVLLLTRAFEIDTAQRMMIVSPEKHLAVFVGSKPIEDWIAEGAPVILDRHQSVDMIQ